MFAIVGLNSVLLGFICRCWALTRCRLLRRAQFSLIAHSLTLVALDLLSLTPLAGVGFNPLRLGMLDTIEIVSALRGQRNSVRWREKDDQTKNRS